MRRVDYIVGARDFKTLVAEQFMQDAVFCFTPEDDGEVLAQTMTEEDLAAFQSSTSTAFSWGL